MIAMQLVSLASSYKRVVLQQATVGHPTSGCSWGHIGQPAVVRLLWSRVQERQDGTPFIAITR